ncbi:M20/M25/M40 family metallo-hydrolase [Micromonospora sp. NPDC051300]|uniref:M20/M25/M40 family metallo-hydrolase n=1 Tax=Micromonospora sp. NPDC051300 TaxID=3364286 RepID=UPI0037AE40D9
MTPHAAERLLQDMVRIPSPSGDEERLARLVVARMRTLGFTARVDAAGNAVGELDRGDGPTVMLLGHLDTAGDTLPVRVANGRLYGRGAVDAKGPLAAMISAAAGASRARGRVVVVGAVEEELPSSRGARLVGSSHPPPSALVVGEPSGWSTVVLGYKGKLDLRYRVTCPAGHPTRPGPKAVELAAAAWETLTALAGTPDAHTAFDRPATTLCSLRGDLTEAEAEFTVRIPLGFDADALVTALRRRLPAGRLEVCASVPACRVERRDPAVRALVGGVRAQGGTVGYKVKTATSDMNTLAEYWNVPMACYGPGDSRLDHSADEHLELAEYHRAIATLRWAVERLTTAPATGSR